MKNKNTHSFKGDSELNSGLEFCESRLVFKKKKKKKDGDPGTPAPRLMYQRVPEPAPRKAAAPVAPKARAGVRAVVERDQVKQDVEQEKKDDAVEEINAVMSKAKVSATDSTEQLTSVDKWVATTKRYYGKLDAKSWNPKNQKGIDEIRDHWGTIGINVAHPYYDAVFKQLSKSFNEPFLSQHPPNVKEVYMHPESHMDELRKIDLDCWRAWDFYNTMRTMMVTWDQEQNLTIDGMKDLDNDPLGSGLMDSVKEIAKKVSKDLKEGNWGSVILGLATLWGAYHIGSGIFSGPAGGEGQKSSGIGGMVLNVAALGALAYGGNELLKIAGYDIGKILGFKDLNSEIEGTSVSYLGRLRVPEAKNVDRVTYLRASTIEMTRLHAAYQVAHPSADRNVEGFIDPSLFDDEFPEFTGFTVSDKEKDDAYRETGKQLYLIAFVLEQAYDKHFRTDETLPRYFNKSLEEALKEPELTGTRVMHFTTALGDYLQHDRAKGTLKNAEIEKAKGRLSAVFNDLALKLDGEAVEGSDGSAVYGEIMGLPVVVVSNAKQNRYQIFHRKDYDAKDGDVKSGLEVVSVPYEASGDESALRGDLVTKFTAKVKEAVAPLQTNMGSSASLEPKYEDGKWTVGVTIPELAKYGIDANTDARARVVITNNGISISMDKGGRPFKVNIDYLLGQRFLHDGLLLGMLSHQDDMQVLAPFYNQREITFVEDHAGEPRFTIKVGGHEVDVTFDADTGLFSIDEDKQKELLGDQLFRQKYVENLFKEERYTEPFDKLSHLFTSDNLPEGFVWHSLTDGLGGIWDEATDGRPGRAFFNLRFADGNINEAYAGSVLDAQRDYLRYSVQKRLGQQDTTFADVATMTQDVMEDVITKLNGIYEEANKHTTNLAGGDWSRIDFEAKILNPLKVDTVASSEYAATVQKLETDLIARYNMQGSELSPDEFVDLNKAKAAFFYYTAYLDDAQFDVLAFSKDEKDDPVTGEYYYRLGYFKYVKTEVVNKSMNIDTYSGPSSWGIKSYEDWKISGGDQIPIDEIDEKAAFTQEPEPLDAAGKRPSTQLEEAYWNEIRKMGDFLERKHGAALNIENINAEIMDHLVGPDTSTPTDKPQFVAHIEELAGKTRRSQQVRLMQSHVSKMYSDILNNKEMFWIDDSLWKKAKDEFDELTN